MIRVGIIGCGSIARHRHAAEYSNNKNAKIVGFFDISKTRAESMVESFGGKKYNSVEEMLEDENIDAVSVCVANAYHAPITIAALNQGKHVLCEKPMAITMRDCEKMLEASKKNNKHLLIDHNQRLTPTHTRAKKILESGELGKVISFTTTFGHKGPEMWSADKSSNTWFFKKNSAAFGSMADLGIHKIDLIRYLVDDEVYSVYSDMATLHKKFSDGTPIEVDDNSVEVLTFKSGIMGTVTTSWTHYGEECNATVLYCEKGIMKLYANPQYSLDIMFADKTKVHYDIDRIQSNEDIQHNSTGVIDMFIDSIINDKQSILDASEVIESMRVVFACLQSTEKGQKILV